MWVKSFHECWCGGTLEHQEFINHATTYRHVIPYRNDFEYSLEVEFLVHYDIDVENEGTTLNRALKKVHGIT